MIATGTPNGVENENCKFLQESSEEEELKKSKEKRSSLKTLKIILQLDSNEEKCGYMSVYSEERGGYEDGKENESS